MIAGTVTWAQAKQWTCHALIATVDAQKGLLALERLRTSPQCTKYRATCPCSPTSPEHSLIGSTVAKASSQLATL